VMVIGVGPVAEKRNSTHRWVSRTARTNDLHRGTDGAIVRYRRIGEGTKAVLFVSPLEPEAAGLSMIRRHGKRVLVSFSHEVGRRPRVLLFPDGRLCYRGSGSAAVPAILVPEDGLHSARSCQHLARP
jgi:hypothetical protein